MCAHICGNGPQKQAIDAPAEERLTGTDSMIWFWHLEHLEKTLSNQAVTLMGMDVWTHGAGVLLDVKHGLKQQQMFVIGATYRYSVITCSLSQKGDKINPLWPAASVRRRRLAWALCSVSVYQPDKSLKSCFRHSKRLMHIHIRMFVWLLVPRR